MASKRDLRSYFTKSDNAKVKSNIQKDKRKCSYPIHIQSASNITGETEIQLVQQEVKKQVTKNNYEIIPLKIKQEIGNYAEIYGTKAATDRFSKIYANFSLKRTTVNAWKKELKKGFSFTGPKKGKTKSCG